MTGGGSSAFEQLNIYCIILYDNYTDLILVACLMDSHVLAIPATNPMATINCTITPNVLNNNSITKSNLILKANNTS